MEGIDRASQSPRRDLLGAPRRTRGNRRVPPARTALTRGVAGLDEFDQSFEWGIITENRLLEENARPDWFFRRTPYDDEEEGLYPVFRVLGEGFLGRGAE